MTINVRQYEQRTLQHDWRGICQLNGIDFKSFWTGNEFNQLENLLAKGEIVFAFLAGNIQLTAKGKTSTLGKDTWLIVLTNFRIILLNASVIDKTLKSKSIRIEKISGMVATQKKALGELVVVVEGGVLSVVSCVANTALSFKSIYDQIRLTDNSMPSPSKEKHAEKEEPAKNKSMTNPFGEEFDDSQPQLDDSQSGASATKASLTALLLGHIGVHDFVWGKAIFGVVKIAFAIAAWRTSGTGHEILSALITLGISIWVFFDILKIFSGRFFRGTPFVSATNATRYTVLVLSVMSAVFCTGNLLSEISDDAKKDLGGLVYQEDVINAYNQNSALAKKSFENRRFSIIGQVGSVEKTIWGNYTVTLEGSGLGYANSQNRIKTMELEFSNRQSKELLRLTKGNRFAASCIGRGLVWGKYSADKCVLKHVRQ